MLIVTVAFLGWTSALLEDWKIIPNQTTRKIHKGTYNNYLEYVMHTFDNITGLTGVLLSIKEEQ